MDKKGILRCGVVQMLSIKVPYIIAEQCHEAIGQFMDKGRGLRVEFAEKLISERLH